MYLATSFVQRGWTWLWAMIEYVCFTHLMKQCVSLTWWVSSCAWLKTVQLQGSAGRWQTEALCLLVFGRCQSSLMLAVMFLWFSVLCYCWQGCRHTKAERNLHRWAAVRGSVSTSIIVGPGTSRCLQVCAVLCIVL
jgi:formate hydrogenlyase subunit 3/multisubunit Na+/H+ antiporter MnhD subunit